MKPLDEMSLTELQSLLVDTKLVDLEAGHQYFIIYHPDAFPSSQVKALCTALWERWNVCVMMISTPDLDRFRVLEVKP